MLKIELCVMSADNSRTLAESDGSRESSDWSTPSLFYSVIEYSTGSCFCTVQTSTAQYRILFSKGSGRIAEYLRIVFSNWFYKSWV